MAWYQRGRGNRRRRWWWRKLANRAPNGLRLNPRTATECARCKGWDVCVCGFGCGGCWWSAAPSLDVVLRRWMELGGRGESGGCAFGLVWDIQARTAYPAASLSSLRAAVRWGLTPGEQPVTYRPYGRTDGSIGRAGRGRNSHDFRAVHSICTVDSGVCGDEAEACVRLAKNTHRKRAAWWA